MEREIEPERALQPAFSTMEPREAMAAQRAVVQKRDYHYDWKALGRDPETAVFGKVPRAEPEDESKVECVANSLRFPSSAEELARPLNAATTKPMPEDFVYGVVTQPKHKEEDVAKREWGVAQCVHSDVVAKPNVLRRDLPGNCRKLSSIYGGQKHVPSRLNPHRVTAGNLVNPNRWSELGVHREQLAAHRDFDGVLALYAKAGFSVGPETAAKIRSRLDEEYEDVCSIDNFEAVMQKLKL